MDKTKNDKWQCVGENNNLLSALKQTEKRLLSLFSI